MGIRRKLILLLLLAIVCVSSLVYLSIRSMGALVADHEQLMSGIFEPLVEHSVPQMNDRNRAIIHLLQADRDSYQVMAALGDPEREEEAMRAEVMGNRAQIRERVGAARELLPPVLVDEMDGRILPRLAEWEKQQDALIALVAATREQYRRQLAEHEEGRHLFAHVRSALNELTDLVEHRFEGAPPEEAKALGRTLALIINADRDCYQAIAAETRAIADLSPEGWQDVLIQNRENLGQIEDRVTRASATMTPDERALGEQILAHLDEWRLRNEEIITIGGRINAARRQEAEARVANAAAFTRMRGELDTVVGILERTIHDGMISLEGELDGAHQQSQETGARMRRHGVIFSFLVFGLGLAFVGMVVYQNGMVRFLSHISDYLNQFTLERLRVPFAPPGFSTAGDPDDELRVLADNLNGMRGRLLGAIEREQEALERRLLYENIVLLAQDPMAYIDVDRTVCAANGAWERLFGAGADPFGEEGAGAGSTASFPRLVSDGIRRCLTGETVHREGWFEDLEGQQRFVVLSLYPHRRQDASVAGVIFSGVDLTRQKRAESAWGESEARFSELFERAPLAILVTDRETFRIVDANRAAVDFYGYPRNELRGKPIREINELPNVPFNEIVSRIEAGSDVFDVTHRLADGTYRQIRSRVVRMRFEGRDCYCSFIIDRTDDIEWEERLRAECERAEAANRAKRNFLAVISHELRTPLNPILGFSSILEDVSDDPGVLEAAHVISNSATRMLEMIDDVLFFSRLSHEDARSRASVFNPAIIVQSVVQVAAENARGNDVRARVDGEGEVRLRRYRGFERGFAYLVRHLVKNAVKFTDNGSVEVALEILPGASDGADRVRVTVVDDGVGIPADKLDAIFTLFEQVDMSISRPFEGAGVGLAVCQKVAQSMDGEIVVDSEEGKGTRVSFEVPLERVHETPAERATHPPFPPASRVQRVLVLVAEGREGCFLGSLLHRFGHQAAYCEHLEDAVARLGRHRFDVILVDSEGLAEDVVEAVRALRACDADGASTPIVVLTHRQRELIAEALGEAGASNVLEKPVLPDELERVLAVSE